MSHEDQLKRAIRRSADIRTREIVRANHDHSERVQDAIARYGETRTVIEAGFWETLRSLIQWRRHA